MYEKKKINSSRTPLNKREQCVYIMECMRVCAQVVGSIVDRVVEKMHNASAAIKNNDDSKNDGRCIYIYRSW